MIVTRFVVGATAAFLLTACTVDPCVQLAHRAERATAARFEAAAQRKGADPYEAIMAAKRREPETDQAGEAVMLLCRAGLLIPIQENQ